MESTKRNRSEKATKNDHRYTTRKKQEGDPKLPLSSKITTEKGKTNSFLYIKNCFAS